MVAEEHTHSDSPSAVHALDALSCGGAVFLVGDDVFVQELSKPGIKHREGGYGSVVAANEGMSVYSIQQLCPLCAFC